MVSISILLGKTLTGILSAKNSTSDDEIFFKLDTGKEYRMYHDQDCCESVYIESIEGDLNDLLDSPITMAEEYSTNHDEKENSINRRRTFSESTTYTFYKLATVKGYVNIRWFGSSNGYYSESVYFSEVGNKYE